MVVAATTEVVVAGDAMTSSKRQRSVQPKPRQRRLRIVYFLIKCLLVQGPDENP